MKLYKVLLTIITSIVLVIIAKKTGLGLFLEVPVILGTFYLTINHRKSIAVWFKKLPLPLFLVAIISYFPFVLLEENINCLQTGCKLIPDTLTFITITIVVLLIVSKIFKVENIKKPIITYSVLGVWFELTYGSSADMFWTLPLPWFIFIVFWVFISYAYVSIMPLSIYFEKEN